MSREPTRHQLSARLAYNAKVPAFLQRLQNRVSGGGADDGDEFEDDGSGRPPIPRRPDIPERPADDPGSADEDDGEERPQVVVLREGKHLTEREAENERRKTKGLPPMPAVELPRQEGEGSAKASASGSLMPSTKSKAASLSFSSSKATVGSKSGKRKAVGDGRDDGPDRHPAKVSKKKHKKAEKKLLSFGDGDA